MMILMAMAVFYGSSYLCIWRPVYGSSYLLTWQPFYGPSYLTWDAWWFFHKSRRLIWLYILVLCLFTLIELFRGLNVMNFSIVKLQLDDSFKWILAVVKELLILLYYRLNSAIHNSWLQRAMATTRGSQSDLFQKRKLRW